MRILQLIMTRFQVQYQLLNSTNSNSQLYNRSKQNLRISTSPKVNPSKLQTKIRLHEKGIKPKLFRVREARITNTNTKGKQHKRIEKSCILITHAILASLRCYDPHVWIKRTNEKMVHQRHIKDISIY